MSDVKRYVVGGVLPFGPHKDERLMIERARGQWVKASDYDALAAKYASAVRTLQDIAAMGATKGCESAAHRLAQLGEPREPGAHE